MGTGVALAGDAGALYVYAVVFGSERRPDGLRGIDDAPVETVAVGDLTAVVSRHGSVAPKATEEALVRHDEVCSALMKQGAVAPLRFGAVFSDSERLAAAIDERWERLHEALTRVEGHVEIGVRVLRTREAEEPAAATGSDYLRRRLEDQREALAAASMVDERLASFAKARRTRTLETPELVLSASYLVAVADVERFRAAAEAVDRERADLDLVCTGPWPPYSFVEGE